MEEINCIPALILSTEPTNCREKEYNIGTAHKLNKMKNRAKQRARH